MANAESGEVIFVRSHRKCFHLGSVRTGEGVEIWVRQGSNDLAHTIGTKIKKEEYILIANERSSLRDNFDGENEFVGDSRIVRCLESSFS